MLYAKIVLGLPVEGPFDYLIPQNLRKIIAVGSRVTVSFGNQNFIGYVVGLSNQTKIKKLKSIEKVLDEIPIVDRNVLLLTKELSQYYCCSWGEAIEAALPQEIRKGKILKITRCNTSLKNNNKPSIPVLVHSIKSFSRWIDVYLPEIKETLRESRSVMIILSDKASVLKTKKIIEDNFDASLTISFRGSPEEIKNWIKIKENKSQIVIGNRSALFAPLSDLGLIIVEEESAYGHKQDQVPHYHAREVAFMRSRIDNTRLILGSSSPSLESILLSKRKKIEYMFIPEKSNPVEVKIIDMKGLPLILDGKKMILAKYLENSIIEALNKKSKVLLFLNRLGFATCASCAACGKILKCPRCNINLVFHYKENTLCCHYCNFKVTPPKICPECNSGYIHYTGIGTEKIESEFSRILPQVKIKQLEKNASSDSGESELFICSQSMINQTNLKFGLIGVLAIDNSLNQVDFRSSEKVFAVLCGLLNLTDKKMVIQTSLIHHHVFKALSQNNPDLFYKEEMKQRKELDFPPYSHLAVVKIRGKIEEKAKIAGNALFEKLKKHENKTIKILSLHQATPFKLRDNFYWQILVTSKTAKGLSKFLKTHLQNLSRSGIIVTVDIDPI